MTKRKRSATPGSLCSLDLVQLVDEVGDVLNDRLKLSPEPPTINLKHVEDLPSSKFRPTFDLRVPRPVHQSESAGACAFYGSKFFTFVERY